MGLYSIIPNVPIISPVIKYSLGRRSVRGINDPVLPDSIVTTADILGIDPVDLLDQVPGIPEFGQEIGENVAKAWAEVVSWTASHPEAFLVPVAIASIAKMGMSAGDAMGRYLGELAGAIIQKEVLF